MVKLNIKGLRTVCSETKHLTVDQYRMGFSLCLYYDTEKGEAWTTAHVGESWTEYHDGNILYCGRLREPMTQAEIREQIERTVDNR